MMKKIGIIGGLGPEATVDYYKEITSHFYNPHADGESNFPEIIIYSVDMGKFVLYLNNKLFDEATNYIVNAIEKLDAAGADFVAISSNTPHLLFNQYQSKTKIHLLSIVECCREKAIQMGLKRCALMGTKFTMKADFYKNSFHKSGIEVISPNETEISFINDKLFTELEVGIVKEETKRELLEIVKKMQERHHIDSVILGCTEFPLMFKEDHYFGIPFLNTTKIHVARIIEEVRK